MAASALDPSFGAGGVVLGPVDSGSAASISIASAMAVQPDGKVVVVGSSLNGYDPAVGSPPNVPLLVQRYNGDGSADSSFGVGGLAVIPVPAGKAGLSVGPKSVAILPGGGIALVATSVVVRLTPAGGLDPTFGAGGEVDLSALGPLGILAAQGDGRIVVAGAPTSTSGLPAPAGEFVVARLTPTGALDPTFNGAGSVRVPAPAPFAVYRTFTAAQVAVDADDRIVLAGDEFYTASVGGLGGGAHVPFVARITAAGALDSTFGSGGTALPPVGSIGTITALAVQADGKVVLAGSTYESGGFVGGTPAQLTGHVVRLLDTGAADPSFRPVASTSIGTSLAATSSLNTVAVAADGTITAGGRAATAAGTALLVVQYLADGTPNPGFGFGGRTTFPIRGIRYADGVGGISDLAINPASNTIDFVGGYAIQAAAATPVAFQAFVGQLRPIPLQAAAGDYDGDGFADVAAQLAGPGVFAFRESSGNGDRLFGFGAAGAGQTIPAPGDYDGDGLADIAAYLPRYGILAYRPSSVGPDVYVTFGSAGVGASIPAPGDYDGDGKTDVAVYLPAFGALAVHPSGGGPNTLTSFGSAGAGASIPAPGDYDGDGRTDVAVYLTQFGALAVRPSGGGLNYLVDFNTGKIQVSIPVPGDYDGDGKTDAALYLPSVGALAVRDSGGASDLFPFGSAGAGASIPAPGDYDGDGKTDVAVYLPQFAAFAIRPSGGGLNELAPFGAAGTGQTVPAASIPYAQDPVIAASGLVAGPGSSGGVIFYLPEDVAPAATARKKS